MDFHFIIKKYQFNYQIVILYYLLIVDSQLIIIINLLIYMIKKFLYFLPLNFYYLIQKYQLILLKINFNQFINHKFIKFNFLFLFHYLILKLVNLFVKK